MLSRQVIRFIDSKDKDELRLLVKKRFDKELDITEDIEAVKKTVMKMYEEESAKKEANEGSDSGENKTESDNKQDEEIVKAEPKMIAEEDGANETKTSKDFPVTEEDLVVSKKPIKSEKKTKKKEKMEEVEEMEKEEKEETGEKDLDFSFVKNPETGNIFALTDTLGKRADLVLCNKEGKTIVDMNR